MVNHTLKATTQLLRSDSIIVPDKSRSVIDYFLADCLLQNSVGVRVRCSA